MPRPRFVTFFFSSSCASSSSSRNSELACSATRRAVAPRPEFVSVVRGCIVLPVDDLRQDDARGEGGTDEEERAGAAAAAGTLRLGAGRRDGAVARLLVLRRPALRAGFDQARLELAQELGVVGQRLREPGGEASFARSSVGHVLQ